MREQLKLIEMMWKSIGRHDICNGVVAPGDQLTKPGSYYDRMEEEALAAEKRRNGLRSVK